MRSKRHEEGFTLIETLVVMLITGIIMGGVYAVYYSQQKSFILQGELAYTQRNLRMAMSTMETEIRNAGCDPTGLAGARIVAAAASAAFPPPSSICIPASAETVLPAPTTPFSLAQ